MSVSSAAATAPLALSEFDSEHHRMLILDLDGTALTGERTLSERDVAAAEALRESGVIVTIATGRLYGGTAAHAETLGVTTTIACMNGSEMLDPRDGRVLSANYLPNAVAVSARDQLRALDVATSLFNSWEIHHCASASPYRRYLATWSQHFREWDNVYQSPAWEEDERLLAVVATGPMASIQAAADALNPDLDQEFYEILAFPAGKDDRGMFMLRDRRENKGTALRSMAAEHGLHESQVVCVGDWINDVPMLQTDALSFAMAGTPEWMLEAAKHAARTVSGKDGGVIVELAERVWGVKV